MAFLDWLFDRPVMKPKPAFKRFPDASEANEWMDRCVEYHIEHYPDSVADLFSPATAAYIPVAVHVGSSWKSENQVHYRKLKSRYPEYVKEAEKITKSLGGFSLARIGDPEDFHEMQLYNL